MKSKPPCIQKYTRGRDETSNAAVEQKDRNANVAKYFCQLARRKLKNEPLRIQTYARRNDEAATQPKGKKTSNMGI